MYIYIFFNINSYINLKNTRREKESEYNSAYGIRRKIRGRVKRIFEVQIKIFIDIAADKIHFLLFFLKSLIHKSIRFD